MEIHKSIREAIQNNRLVIFAGSGLSIKFGLPSWDKLVYDIINDTEKEEYQPFLPILSSQIMTPIEILEKLKPEHNSIKKYIINNFNIKNGDYTTHKNLIELSGQIITTNYDNAFENASNNTINPSVYTSEFNISEINKNGESYIFKLHGTYLEPDKCIIFKENYDTLYSQETAAKEKLKSIFTEKTILFIGFSFNDPDINLIFKNLDQAFGNNNKHYILTKNSEYFKEIRFIDPIQISDYNEIDSYIEKCLTIKKEKLIIDIPDKETDAVIPIKDSPKVAILYPSPIDIDMKEELLKVVNSFNSLDTSISIGTLNLRTLITIEDYDLLIIVTKVFKSNLYIEDENLKSKLVDIKEICSSIPNDKIPIIFITNEKIQLIKGQTLINISSFKNAIINKFIYKTLKSGETNYIEEEITLLQEEDIRIRIKSGVTKFNSIYKTRDLDIGKKCLSNVIGRIEEQSSIALKLISIIKSNKILNIKASGGTGKTTLIKKIAYELYNRGYFTDGVSFKSCESVKTYEDFEEILISGFNLTNILNFKEYLVDNFSFYKKDLLIILDNFETVVNTLKSNDLQNAIELLKFASDYANITLTSREKFSTAEDFEDVYSLTPLITDDALKLFVKEYGAVTDENEIRILRSDILEDLLNNNPLAIKLVTKSRTRFNHITELKKQIIENFFESTDENYAIVYSRNADLNIEKTKSIYQSINYSYTTLDSREKLAFELLNLFPDGISLSNFKKCFERKNNSNNISDRELRSLRDKSLVEDYNGMLQLQPIIRRFAEHQFLKRPAETKQRYCLDAYVFNCFILDFIESVEYRKTLSEALLIYAIYKNNLLNVLTYIEDIKISSKGPVSEKQFLLNFIYSMKDYIVNEKQINEFQRKIVPVKRLFSDLPNAELLIEAVKNNQIYYYQEFDKSYQELSEIFPIEDMIQRKLSDEDYIERRYKNIISNIHSMEGYTLQYIKSFIENKDTASYHEAHFFYLGIENNISRKKDGFYYFEYELMFKILDPSKLEEYIDSLYQDEHLERMQCTYTLSKVKNIDKKTILKLVVTNPYTFGLKQLMLASVTSEPDEKIKHFESALYHLSHIKYYYIEALYYYCKFLKEINHINFQPKKDKGIELSGKFHYQYLNFLFLDIDNQTSKYNFDYSFYPIEGFEEYVKSHNDTWEKLFKDMEIENLKRI